VPAGLAVTPAVAVAGVPVLGGVRGQEGHRVAPD